MGDVFQDAARQDVALQAYRDVFIAVLKNVTDSRAELVEVPNHYDQRTFL